MEAGSPTQPIGLRHMETSPTQGGSKELVAVLEGLRETLVGAQPRDDRAVETDRLNAIAGFEFKQNISVIKDSDFEFERHVRDFQSILDCHTIGPPGRSSDMIS